MEDCVKSLEESLKTVAKEQNYNNYKTDIKQISTRGANYTGHLFLVTIVEPGKKDLKLFAKAAAMGEKMREKGARVYKVESFFYNKLIQKYENLEKTLEVHEKDKFMRPKFFGSSSEERKEMPVLEDLTARGFEPFDRFKNVTWEQASKSVEQLAKLHSLSLALEIKYPEDFEETKAALNAIYDSHTGQNFKFFLKNFGSKVYEATRNEDKERVAKFMEDTLNSENFHYVLSPIKKPIIIHGDFRPSNLMYKYDGSCQAITLDFQTMRYGSPLYDLYFINLGSDNKFRQKYFKATIDHYYSELCSALRKLYVDPDVVYSRKDFEYEYTQILPYLLVIGMCFLLVVTVDEEDAPKGDDLGRIELDINAFLPNQRFQEKLAELIDFYSNMEVL